jgi:molybdopterin molybdotransferase
MVSVEEAESIILAHPLPLKIKQINLEDANGKILAEKIFADRDFPPFHRVAMDGIAINREGLRNNNRQFTVMGLQAAGQPPQKVINPTECIEVMTGAVLPEGTDAVVRYEDIKIEKGIALLLVEAVAAGENIHPAGQDAKKNDVLLPAGTRLTSAEIALLAAVGKNSISIYDFPNAAIVSTGNELVDITDTPAPWQVRRSNVYALHAALQDFNIHASLFHLDDDEPDVIPKLKTIVDAHEIILLSGGVSKGKYDFVPQALEAAGIQKLFHQINQKPGKPFWFGKGARPFVFALPGNPVSTFLCYYRYVKPWLKKSAGLQQEQEYAILAKDFMFTPPMTYFLQVKVSKEAGRLLAIPEVGGGSGDFVNLKSVDGFLELPAHQSRFAAGEIFPLHRFRS